MVIRRKGILGRGKGSAKALRLSVWEKQLGGQCGESTERDRRREQYRVRSENSPESGSHGCLSAKVTVLTLTRFEIGEPLGGYEQRNGLT